MSINNSKDEIEESELYNPKNLLNLELNHQNKEENNFLPSFLIESLNECEDDYFKDDDQENSTEERNSIDSLNSKVKENEKNISNQNNQIYNMDFNYKMHSFDDSKKIKNFQFNNFNFAPNHQFITSNNSIFNNQISNSKQYSFNNKNSNVNRLYQQFFQMQSNFPQINPQFQIMNNYCINQMILNINNNNNNNNNNNILNNNNKNESYNQQKKNNINKKNKNNQNEKNNENITMNSLFLLRK